MKETIETRELIVLDGPIRGTYHKTRNDISGAQSSLIEQTSSNASAGTPTRSSTVRTGAVYRSGAAYHRSRKPKPTRASSRSFIRCAAS